MTQLRGDQTAVKGVLVSLCLVGAHCGSFLIDKRSTNRSGVAEFTNVPHGEYDLSVTDYPKNQNLTFYTNRSFQCSYTGRQRRFTFEFVRTGGIRGRVSCEDGSKGKFPVSVQRLNVKTGYRGPVGAVDTLDDGTFEVHDLIPGRYYLSMWRAGSGIVCAKVDVSVGETSTVELNVKRANGEVRAQLVSQGGAPLADVPIYLNTICSAPDLPSTGREVRTSDQGIMNWDGVPLGDYQLVSWRMRLMRVVTVGAQDTDLGRLVVPSTAGTGEIDGVIVTSDGSRLQQVATVCVAGDALGQWWRIAESKWGGTFHFRNLAAGTYRMWIEPSATMSSFRPTKAKTIQVQEQATTQVALQAP